MENDDDDVAMVDVPSTRESRLNSIPVGGKNGLFSRPRIPGSSVVRSAIPNGHPDSQLSSAQPSDNEANIFKSTSREASVLAHDASNLSIQNLRPSQPQFEAFLTDLENEQEEEHENPAPFLSELKTGYCYDVRMRYHCELEPPKDRRDYHPEDPRRIFAIYKELCVGGLIYDKLLSQGTLVSKPLQQIDVREASEAEIELVHEVKHWQAMKITTSKHQNQILHTLIAEFITELKAEELIRYGYLQDSVYVNGITFECAKLSAGGTIETARAVADGLVKNAIAIVRPPGHHAECNRPMGFCIFDNVSIATRVCMATYPEKIRKVLILDWYIQLLACRSTEILTLSKGCTPWQRYPASFLSGSERPLYIDTCS